jgi:hypothetical protein
VIEAICDDNAIPLDVGAPPAPYPSGKNINYAPKSTRLLPKSRLFFCLSRESRNTWGVHAARDPMLMHFSAEPFRNLGASIIYLLGS